MSATVVFQEDNGAATGSPAKGTTRADAPQVNWKNLDDIASTCRTPYNIRAGNNSFEKFQFAKFTGSFTSISAGLWAHTSGVLGTGLTLKGVVTSTYTTPSTATNAALTQNMTSAIGIGSGQTVLFSTTGPEAASPGASISAPGYSQYLVTQLQTSGSADSGDTATVELTLQWDEA